jgi:hypothetical protein
LKAAKEDTSAPGPSSVVTSVNAPIPTVNKDASVQAVLPAPTPSTSCTYAPSRSLKNIKTRLIRLKHLKRRKKRTRRQQMSKNKHDVLLVVEPITLAPPASCVL